MNIILFYFIFYLINQALNNAVTQNNGDESWQ